MAKNNDEQCKGCNHLQNPQGGYCYMFETKMVGCRLNTTNKRNPKHIQNNPWLFLMGLG